MFLERKKKEGGTYLSDLVHRRQIANRILYSYLELVAGDSAVGFAVRSAAADCSRRLWLP